jgi:simple sugar transport system permease protein
VGNSALHISAVWWLVSAVVFWVLLEKTRYGNWVYGPGGAAALPGRSVCLSIASS